MKKFLFASISSILLIIMFSSCKTFQNITIEDNQSSDTITLNLKDTLTISLVSNASTGYKWNYTDENKFLKLIESKSEAPKSKLIGAAGKKIFVFKAVKKGEVNLKLYYTRANIDTAKVFEKFVIIK